MWQVEKFGGSELSHTLSEVPYQIDQIISSHVKQHIQCSYKVNYKPYGHKSPTYYI